MNLGLCTTINDKEALILCASDLLGAFITDPGPKILNWICNLLNQLASSTSLTLWCQE